MIIVAAFVLPARGFLSENYMLTSRKRIALVASPLLKQQRKAQLFQSDAQACPRFRVPSEETFEARPGPKSGG